MSTTTTSLNYKPFLAKKPLLKALTFLCYVIAGNTVLRFIAYGTFQYQPEKLGQSIWTMTVLVLAFVGMFAAVAIVQLPIMQVVSLIQGKPLFVIRGGKLMVLDHSDVNTDASTDSKANIVAT